MKFEVFSELQYEVRMPTTFIFNIQVSRSSSQTILEEKLVTDPSLRLDEFTSASGEERFLKLEVKEKITFKITYSATVDLHYNVIKQKELLKTVPVIKLDADVIPY